MDRYTNEIEKEYEKLQQKNRQKKLQEYRENKKREAVNTRRLIIIGELFVRYFPEVRKFQPHLTDAENTVEFAPLETFLSNLSTSVHSTTQGTQSTRAEDVSVRLPTQNTDNRNGGRG